jgi:hypothetical protein
MTEIDDAICALFDDPNVALDALYQAGGAGPGVTVRVMRVQPNDMISSLAGLNVVSTGTVLAVHKSQIAAPKSGDKFTLSDTGEIRTVQAAPKYEQAAGIWNCDCGG